MRTMRNCRDTGNEISITKLNKQMKRKRDGKKENYVALSHFLRDLEYLTFPVSLIHSSDTLFSVFTFRLVLGVRSIGIFKAST